MEEKAKEKTPHNLKNFIDYYKQLKIFDSEQEYETFSQFLLQDLPICFRLNTVMYLLINYNIFNYNFEAQFPESKETNRRRISIVPENSFFQFSSL